MPEPIDVARLSEFSDGTPKGLRELTEMFLTHLGECAEALRPAVAGARAAKIKSQAHKVAGAAACGAQRRAGLLKRMEILGANLHRGMPGLAIPAVTGAAEVVGLAAASSPKQVVEALRANAELSR